ncbi:hypothetical protein BaRGS_00031215 [Batillaria attramentaria]|uniref:Uncharacterized protein n=1 Tax=Batillaria attramentaria TaxID=370345 RepID=A0ABD0JR52_9CAEN
MKSHLPQRQTTPGRGSDSRVRASSVGQTDWRVDLNPDNIYHNPSPLSAITHRLTLSIRHSLFDPGAFNLSILVDIY